MTLIGKLMRTCSKSQCQSVTAGDGISWAPGSAPRSSLPKSSSGQQPRSPTHHHSFCCTRVFCFSCNIQERIPYTKIRINIIFWGKNRFVSPEIAENSNSTMHTQIFLKNSLTWAVILLQLSAPLCNLLLLGLLKCPQAAAAHKKKKMRT